jgi:heme/copper-type cytochrome/quinol oxidase subunit 2
MEASMTGMTSRPRVRKPLAMLGKLTTGALVGLGIVFGYAQIVFGEFDPMLTGVAAAMLIVAGVVAVGWRWAPALGALLALAIGGGLLVPAIGEIVFSLTHPTDSMFILMILLLSLLALTIAAGVGATVQNYRSAERRTPRGLPTALTALAGLIAGAVLISVIAKPTDAVGVTPEVLAGLPSVTLEAYNKGEVRVKAGEMVALRLENADGASHSFDVDELNVHALMPGGKSSLALFKPTKPGAYTFYCGIPGHYDKATGEGMHGTLIVE